MTRNNAEPVYDELKQQIVSGKLRPAERLVEATLAENLDTSRYNIRAALDRLQVDGLVEIEANKGARVSALTREEVVDMYVAREGLEAEVVRLACESITEAQLNRLHTYLLEMEEAYTAKRFELYSDLNKRFHETIYEASGNRTLPDLITQLRLRLLRLNMRVILLPGRGDSSLEEHTAIYDALAQRDTVKAIQAVRQHISAVRQDVENGWELVKF